MPMSFFPSLRRQRLQSKGETFLEAGRRLHPLGRFLGNDKPHSEASIDANALIEVRIKQEKLAIPVWRSYVQGKVDSPVSQHVYGVKGSSKRGSAMILCLSSRVAA